MDPFDSADRLLAASLHGATALVWATLAYGLPRSHGTVRPEGGSLWLFRFLCGLLAAHYAFNMVVDLTSFSAHGVGSGLYLWGCSLTQTTTIVLLPVMRHLVSVSALGVQPPGRAWLTLNYGSVAAVALAQLPSVKAFLGGFDREVDAYLVIMTALILADMLRLSRRRWRPLLMADLGFAGFAALAVAVFGGVVAIVMTENPIPHHSMTWVVSHTLVGFLAATPFVLRILGEAIRQFLVNLVILGSALWIYFKIDAASAVSSDAELARLIDLGGVGILFLVIGPGRAWLRSGVDRFVLCQDRRWSQHLRGFLESQSPAAGVEEICRRAVSEVTRNFGFAGAAIILDEQGRPPSSFKTASDKGVSAKNTSDKIDAHKCICHKMVADTIDIDALVAVWPGEDKELPDGTFDLLWLRDPVVQEALYEAKVTWIVPIVSHQRRWGHLFVAAGPWGIAAGDDKVELLEGFMHQLALVLDVADLLERSLAVERELAQVERLAAVGETAARLAHEIRNPVTAARSLGQMMAQDPGSPLNAEHAGLIVRELDRVERQVKLLLGFARDESYRPQPLSLADLVRETMSDLEAGFADDRLDVELGVTSDVTVEADPERLRQVVVNLVNNAVDALADSESPKRLEVSVAADNGDAVLTVADSGPGVDSELLPRIFDPFVSRKPKGTGLGLAIAKRIVEAHGGRIEADPEVPAGIAFHVHLPVSA